MYGDIKLCASTFNVVTLADISIWRLFSTCIRVALGSWFLSRFTSVERDAFREADIVLHSEASSGEILHSCWTQFNHVYPNHTAPIYRYVKLWDKRLKETGGAPPHFSRRAHAFLDREFPDLWIGTEGLSTWPPRSPDLTPLDFFLLVICKGHFYRKKCKMWMSCVAESSELQSALPMNFRPFTGEKLGIVLMCVILLMVPILRCNEHIRNFKESNVWKCMDFSNSFYGWRNIYIMFHLIAT
jgi:hypothetical protein